MALEVAVKAAFGAPHLLGDFSDRPFQPEGSSDLEGEESALQIALHQSQRQTQWFTEVNPEGKVPVVKFDDKWVADSDVIVGIIEEKYPEPSLKTPPEFASLS